MKKRMNYKELSQFYDSIAYLWKSGLPISQGFETMKKGKKGPKFWMIDGLQHHVARGETLADAMTRFPKFFDDFQTLIIKAAEESGKIVETCHGLSRYYEMRHREKKRLIGSMIYPVLLLHAAVLLPNLKYLVVPSLDKSYPGAVLPPLLIVYGLLAAGYVAWKKFCRTGRPREIIDGVFLSLPLIGKLARGFSLARVFRTLANLLYAGIESVQAARKAALTAGNRAIAMELSRALPVLENGGTFIDYFTFSGVLNTTQLGMVAVGEEGGALVETLGHMVRYLDEENSRRFTTAIKAFGYAVYFIVTAIIAVTVISFYSSHFSI
jgi:type II secretory pathway component PulF